MENKEWGQEKKMHEYGMKEKYIYYEYFLFILCCEYNLEIFFSVFKNKLI